MTDFVSELVKASKLEDNWDGEGAPAPNSKAFRLAWPVMAEAKAWGVTSLVPSVEGGIGVCLTPGRYIEFGNDGEVTIWAGSP